ncbi:uncharacterized protein LOC125298805 [Alosa alosa]|uniref:uncharacterized protein LOC125298805 n=1 Tax=Alosa alosa TaxID=278164 RepID=UPI00201555B9|nr:uncharacterized protein LOC125298805 [Alosa alosa]
MDYPNRDDRHCKPSATLPLSSPEEQEENTSQSHEETTTPSEEVRVGLPEEREPASLTEIFVRASSSDATCEGLEKKQVSALGIQTVNESSNPTRSENLSIGDHAKWWDWYQNKYGYLFKDDYFAVQSLEWGDLESESSNDLSDDSDSDEVEDESQASEESMVVDVPGTFVPCNPVVMEVYYVAILEWRRCLLTERVPERDGPGLNWGLLALVCKMGGVVSGRVIAELLLQKMKTFDKAASRATADTTTIAMALIAGKAEEALDLAMSRGLMHHAFILRSFIGKQPSLWVKKFFDSVENADPLKTYYQVRLGEIPSVATACGNESMGDWRLHLAMVLTSPPCHGFHASFGCRQETVAKMGETFASKGLTHAARFCQMLLELQSEYPDTISLINRVTDWMNILRETNGEGMVGNVCGGQWDERSFHGDAERFYQMPSTAATLNSRFTMTNTVSFDATIPRSTREERLEQRLPTLDPGMRQQLNAAVIPANPQQSMVEEKDRANTQTKIKKKSSKKKSWFKCFGCFACFGRKEMD